MGPGQWVLKISLPPLYHFLNHWCWFLWSRIRKSSLAFKPFFGVHWAHSLSASSSRPQGLPQASGFPPENCADSEIPSPVLFFPLSVWHNLDNSCLLNALECFSDHLPYRPVCYNLTLFPVLPGVSLCPQRDVGELCWAGPVWPKLAKSGFHMTHSLYRFPQLGVPEPLCSFSLLFPPCSTFEPGRFPAHTSLHQVLLPELAVAAGTFPSEARDCDTTQPSRAT